MGVEPEGVDELRNWADALAGVDITRLRPVEDVFPTQSDLLYESLREILGTRSSTSDSPDVRIFVGPSHLRVVRGGDSCDTSIDEGTFDSVEEAVVSVAYAMRDAD